MSKLLDNYTDDQLSGLASALISEVSIRQATRKKEAERRVKITLTFAELESLWRYGIRGDKVAMVEKYIANSAEYYFVMLSGKYGAEQIYMRWSMGSGSVVNSIPENARQLVSPKVQAARLEAARKETFLTDWQYESVVEHNGQTFHLWSCQHREGYTAYTLTHQPKDSRVQYIKPEGTGHYTSIEGLCQKTGIPRSSLSV